MGELLNKIEEHLNDLESSVSLAFRNLRTGAGDSEYAQLPSEFRQQMRTEMQKLQKLLDRTGSREELTLTTEKHENLRTRFYVINRLIDRKVPLAAFHQADAQLKEISHQSGSSSQVSKAAPSNKAYPSATSSLESRGIIDSIKNFFSTKKTVSPEPANRVIYSETAPAPAKEIYKETGIYGPAQELAMLALVVGESARSVDRSETRKPAERGKARFEARDLTSTTHAPTPPPKQTTQIAKTPEEIRKKLAARQHQAPLTGKASFTVQDPSETVNIPAAKTKPELRKPENDKVPVTNGKAVFESRDITANAKQRDERSAKT